MFNSIGDILELISSEDWESFRSNVLSEPTIYQNLAGAVAACSALNGMTMLHAAVRYNPPLDIIVRMVQLCPNSPSSRDCLHRTPLHVAAGSQASPLLIRLLAHAYPAACDALDKDGKTPLHFACDSSCVLFEEDLYRTHTTERPSHDTIVTLLSYSLYPVMVKDHDGVSPQAYAIMSNASKKTVELLRSSARDVQLLDDRMTCVRSMQMQSQRSDFAPCVIE